MLKITLIVPIGQVFPLLLLTYKYLKYILILVVSIHTYGIVPVPIVHVRDFMDVLEVHVKPIFQMIDDVDLRMARSI